MAAILRTAAAWAALVFFCIGVPAAISADAGKVQTVQQPIGELGQRERDDTARRRPSSPGGKAAAPQPSQQRVLDDLFARLKRSDDADESEGIARSIKRIWLRSGSDTADLLMTRAGKAMTSKNAGLAEKLLDKVVALEPDWAEAWNRRATVRYGEFDDTGAMADIAQVLIREPRHFGALSGMGYILERHDMHKQALKVFRQVLALYPQQEEIRKMVDKLSADVEGRDI